MAKLQQINRKDGSSVFSIYLTKHACTIARFFGGDNIDVQGLGPGKILLVKKNITASVTTGEVI